MRITILHQRYEWIDFLKTIGILAVILGHISSPLGKFIYSWHMPLFFILSGFFIKTNISLVTFLKQNTKRLILPYFIFSIMGVILEIIKRSVLNRVGLDYLNEISGVFLWMDQQSLKNTYALVLWFLPALYIAKLFLFAIEKYVKLLLLQIILVCIFFICSFFVNLPFAIDNGLNGLFFLFIGNIYYRFFQNERKMYILLPFVIIIFYLFGLHSMDMANKNYSNILINILWAISISLLLIEFTKKIKLPAYVKNVVNMWGANTMIIFIIHVYTNNVAHLILEKYNFGFWAIKFLVSVFLVQMFLYIKTHITRKGKYVNV